MNGLNDRLAPANSGPHTVLPTASHSVSSRARSHDTIHAVYPEGISFIDELGAMEGYLTILGAMTASLPVWALHYSLTHWQSHGPDWLTLCIFTPALIIALLMIRSDTIAYRYQPVLFNRATGKVHVFLAQSLTWWKLWQLKPPSRIETWDWDCIRAEVVEFTVFTGSGAPSKNYALVGAVVDQPGSLNVISRFGIGGSYPWSPDPMVERWEHVRRYMRNEGPALAPGDSLFHDASTHRFWAALWFGQPLIGPGSRQYWTGEFLNGWWFLTIPGGMLFLAMLPFSMAAGLLRWLSHKAKREPKWTPEILASLGGPALSIAELSIPPQTWTQRRKALKQQRKQ